MERDIKGLIDSIDQKDKIQSQLEQQIDTFKTEINKLKFTIKEQKILIQSLQEKNSEVKGDVDEEIQLLKEMIFSQRQKISDKDKEIEILKEKIDGMVTDGDFSSTLATKNLSQAKKKIKELTSEKETYKTTFLNAKEQYDHLKKENEALIQEIEGLQKELQTSKLKADKTQELDYMYSKIERLNSDIKDYRIQVFNLKQSIENIETTLEKTREDSEKQIKELKDENEGYKALIDSLKAQLHGVEKKEINTELKTDVGGYKALEEYYGEVVYNLEQKLEEEQKKSENSEQVIKSLKQQLQDLKGGLKKEEIPKKKRIKGFAGTLAKQLAPLQGNENFKKEFGKVSKMICLNPTDGKYAALIIVDKGELSFDYVVNTPRENLSKKNLGWDGRIMMPIHLFLDIGMNKLSLGKLLLKILSGQIKIKSVRTALLMVKIFKFKSDENL